MTTKYIQLGDALVERARVTGARYVPEDSPAAHENSNNCVRLELRRPDQVVSIHPLGGQTLEELWQGVTDHLNGIEREPAPAAETDTESADEEPSATDEGPSAETATVETEAAATEEALA